MGIVFGGLLAGLIHVLSGPDHLAAIAPYASLQGIGAWKVGLRWGLGHTGGVLVVGILALLLRGILPIEKVSAYSERLVGLVLIGIGVWGLRTASRVRPEVFTISPGSDEGAEHPPHSHGIFPTHASHKHLHAAFGVGMIHGLAGSSHLLGILPALALPSTFAAGAWLLLFGVGTVLGMTAFATLLGLTARRLQSAGIGVYRALLYLCACAAIGVGVFWLFSSSH